MTLIASGEIQSPAMVAEGAECVNKLDANRI